MGKKWKVLKSKIEGVGLFATRDIVPNEYIGTAVKLTPPKKFSISKNFGSLINHKSYPRDNASLERVGNRYFVVANNFIPKGKEILLDYDENPSFLQGSLPHYK